MSPLNTYRRLCARSVSLPFAYCFFFWLCVLVPASASAQTQAGEEQKTGYLRLNVKVALNENDRAKGLQRKRFYLIKVIPEKSEALKALVDKISKRPFMTRRCFYTGKASPKFIDWLTKGDCESVYCRSIEEEYITSPTAVPEFQKAFEQSVNDYESPELGRLWLTTNLTELIRDGFYRAKQKELDALIDEAQLATSAPVYSVMTDTKGTANFTNLTLGSYLVSNLIPIELGTKSILWACEVEITPGKTDKFVTNSTKECAIELALPACDANRQSASIR